MNFFPHFPLQINVITLFSLTLLLGLLGGELIKKIPFLPRILGYIAVGFMLGPVGLNVVDPKTLAATRIFVDISLGIILFDLGRQLDFIWLKNDRGLLLTAIAESGLTFMSIFLLFYFVVQLPLLPSALAATFAIATSPAVVMMVANDLTAEGPVTRRALILTSLNNLFALVIFILLLPQVQIATNKGGSIWLHTAYLLAGPFFLAMIIYCLMNLAARIVGKNKQNQFILFVSVVVLTIGLAQVFKLPIAFTLFILGVATRNFDVAHRLMEIDFGWSARIFFIVLFVVTGVYLHTEGLKSAAFAIVLFILLRSLAKAIGVWMCYRTSRLTKRQMISVSLSLTPMAGLVISMSNMLGDFNPELSRQITVILVSTIAILEVIGPIATQVSFIMARETLKERK
jgi:Kef-type K+ transport system membrane component KefB